jgi:hypothetical protein
MIQCTVLSTHTTRWRGVSCVRYKVINSCFLVLAYPMPIGLGASKDHTWAQKGNHNRRPWFNYAFEADWGLEGREITFPNHPVTSSLWLLRLQVTWFIHSWICDPYMYVPRLRWLLDPARSKIGGNRKMAATV